MAGNAQLIDGAVGRRGESAVLEGTVLEVNGDQMVELRSAKALRRVMHVERLRAERSRRAVLLMLIDASPLLLRDPGGATQSQIICCVSRSIRETDVAGWFKTGEVIGVVFTEISLDEASASALVLVDKMRSALEAALPQDQAEQIDVVVRVFPDPSGSGEAEWEMYKDTDVRRESKKGALRVKAALDLLLSFAALVLLSPLLAAIAIGIKLTSRGPVLYKQQRVGLYGRSFTFLKFRSMYEQNDPTIHQEYVARFITNGGSKAGGHTFYKMAADPRVTPIGRILRRTSLDELPQFFNVLLGDMSLVGPRPPIPYEVDRYHPWHRNRFLFVKPGITGLWQVRGRSRTAFDEMVRMDLAYLRSWSLWLDLKILLQTPWAVLKGDGAC